MKTKLLFLILVAFYTNVQAQKNVPVSDSFFFGETNALATRLSGAYYYQYDSVCSIRVFQYKLLNSSTRQLADFQQTIYSHYPSGNLYQYTLQYWKGTAYQDSTRGTYTYNAKGKIGSQLTEIWTNNSFWQPQLGLTNTYDTSGNLINALTKYWSSDSMKLVNSSETKYTYNSSGKTTLITSQQWNVLRQAWIPVSQTVQTYDAQQFLIKREQQNWDQSSSSWYSTSLITYYNNSQGKADSAVYSYPNNSNTVYRYYYLYDSVTSVLKEYDNYEYINNVRVTSDQTFYSHFLSDSLKSDTTIYGRGGPDAFSVQSQYATTDIYNADHTVRDHFDSYNWNDGDVPNVAKSHFTYTPCQSVLPVSLLAFTGKPNGNDVLLTWQTANEVNLFAFQVQRSTDGVHFTPIGNVLASGSNNTYSYTDNNISSLQVEKLYYKLLITSRGGGVSYSSIVFVHTNTKDIVVYASPNPVKDILFLQSKISLPDAAITLGDMSGKVVFVSHQAIPEGNKIPVNVSSLAKGMYILHVRSATINYTIKIAKQ